MRPLIFAIESLALTLFLGGLAHSQTIDLSTDVDPDSALVVTVNEIPGSQIRLSDSIELALANATDAREAQAAYEASAAEVMREKGLFDPEIFALLEHGSEEIPSASVLAGAPVLDETLTSTTAGARVLLPFGTQLEASISADHRDSNNSFSILNPENRASGRLELRQPLLNGLGPSTRGALSAAEQDLLAAQARYEDTILAVRASVEAAYWELYAAERDYAVSLLVVERAEALVNEARVRADAGLVGPNQVANARVFLAEQALLSLDQEERLDAVSDRLATLIGQRPATDSRYRVQDMPSERYEFASEDTLVARSLDRNWEVLAARRDLDADKERVRAAKWGALPSLDLFGALGGNGLSGTFRDSAEVGRDSGLRGDFTDAVADAIQRDFGAWSVGLELSFPIFLREGRGEHERLQAESAKRRHQLIAVERGIEERVRESYRRLENGQRRLGLARDGVDASREQIRIGFIEFENGRTSAFELVRLGADLITAQQRLSQAMVRTATAAAELRRWTGNSVAP